MTNVDSNRLSAKKTSLNFKLINKVENPHFSEQNNIHVKYCTIYTTLIILSKPWLW